MKLSVIGAGAIGSMFGGLIKYHVPETDVTLIARGEHGEQMKKQGGVTLKGPRGTAKVSLAVSDALEQIANSDYVLLTVKSYSTDESMRSASGYLGDATVISIQNGINQHVLLKYVSPRRLVMGMTASSIAVAAPGTVEMRRNDVTVIGPGGADTPESVGRAAQGLLGRSGLKTAYEPQILGAQYNKLVFNCLGAASSLSASDFIREAVLHGPWRNVVAIPLQQESLRVLAQAGIRLSRVPGASDAWRFRRLLHLLSLPALGGITAMAMRLLINRKEIRFSLGSDLNRRRRTEVDFINGEIVRLADHHGLQAPRNAKVVELVHELERRGGLYTRDEVISIFHEIA